MSKPKYEPVAFADVKVGDTIKSVAPCGTVRRGVVVSIEVFGLYDENDGALGYPVYIFYRRVPKPAKFVPLDVPEAGQWGEFTLRDGRVVKGRVDRIEDYARFGPDSGSAWHVYISGEDRNFFINAYPETMSSRADIISWRPTTPPAPEEPSGFGYVGCINNGDEWQVNRYTVFGEVLYERTRVRDGRIEADQSWKRIVDFGTFTAVTK